MWLIFCKHTSEQTMTLPLEAGDVPRACPRGASLCLTLGRERRTGSWKSSAPTSHLAQKCLQSLREGEWGRGGAPLSPASAGGWTALPSGFPARPPPCAAGRVDGDADPHHSRQAWRFQQTGHTVGFALDSYSNTRLQRVKHRVHSE